MGFKFIESYPVKNRFVKTHQGKAKILEIHKTIKYPKYKIILENGYVLEGASKHVIIDKDFNEIYIKDSLNKDIITDRGISKVIKVIDLKIQEHFYDISIDSEDELYFSNGILSHNSGKCVVGDTDIVIKDNETGEIKKVSIEEFHKMIEEEWWNIPTI